MNKGATNQTIGNITPNNSSRMNKNTKINSKPVNSSSIFRNSGNSTNSVGGKYSSSNVFGIVLLVVVILLIVYACYWAYGVYSSRAIDTSVVVEALPDVKDAASKFEIGSGSIPSSKYSNEFSVSMWLNINDYTYNYGKEKVILRRGTTSPGNLEIVLGEKSNDLIVRLKLQGPVGISPLTVSKFQNIPSSLSPLSQLQTHQYNINEPNDTGYIHGAFDLQGTTTKIVPCNNTVFNEVSGNQINYPGIKYDIATGCDNALNVFKPADAMTIMVEQSTRAKEGFNISDNSAPLESQVIQEQYFDMVSGNTITTSGKRRDAIERFDSTSDLVNACAAVLIDLCKLADAFQSQSSADDQVSTMNLFFQQINTALEAARTNSKTSDDVSTAFENNINNLDKIFTPNDNIIQKVKQLQTDLITLQSLQDGSNVDFATIQSAVNAKLVAANCSLTLNGTTEIDATVNFFENFINALKKSLYTYINNMGSGIRKEYGDLNTNQNVSCLIDSSINNDPTVGTCVYKMIPLQKWVHVVVSVYNQVIDIYIDGQLGSSCILKGFPAISTNDVNITPDGGFAGQISRVSFLNTAMNVGKARSMYYDGPVKTDSIFSLIPNWVWYVIIFIIIIAIIYSVIM